MAWLRELETLLTLTKMRPARCLLKETHIFRGFPITQWWFMFWDLSSAYDHNLQAIQHCSRTAGSRQANYRSFGSTPCGLIGRVWSMAGESDRGFQFMYEAGPNIPWHRGAASVLGLCKRRAHSGRMVEYVWHQINASGLLHVVSAWQCDNVVDTCRY